MEKILTAEQMRHAEQLTEKAWTSTAQLMQNAGAAAARVIAEALARGGPEARVLILCGPGNNGGDGLVAAERLSERGYAVAAYTFRGSTGALSGTGRATSGEPHCGQSGS